MEWTARARRQPSEWSDDDEIHFLDNLGTWRSKAWQQSMPDRTVLLRRYLAAMPSRSTWGAVDRHRIRKHVLDMLIGAQIAHELRSP